MSDIDIRKYLEKIVGSESFSRSEIYKRLLEYLTEATLKGEKPKEFTIGLDVFNQKADDPASSNVRVYVHKLRKKLDNYYTKEGLHDQVYFSIPKGAYTLSFKDRKDVFHGKQIKKVWLIIMGILLIALINFIILFSQRSDYQQLGNTSFWSELVENKKPTVVVAGDFFVYADEKLTSKDGRYRNIRDVQINTEEQLRAYVNSNDSLDLKDYEILKNVSYMPRDALFSMPYIVPLLERNGIDYQIVLSSNFKWEVFNDHNIIYLGSLKNLRSLSLLTEKLNVIFDHITGTLTLTGPDEPRSYTSYFLNQDNLDYTLLSKMPGPNNNVIYFFASNHDIGVIESVKYFMNLESLNRFNKNTLKDASFFRAIFKTEGIERTGVTFKMMEYEPIIDSTLYNFWN